MSQADLFEPTAGETVSLLMHVLRRSDQVLVKKLSNNDRDWARFANKHQAGVYIPPPQREGGFFPPLVTKDRGDKGGEPIREVYFRTEWPEVEETRNDTRLVHYTSKGPETHMTRLPKAAFRDLSPASFLVMARKGNAEAATYECLTVDSTSDDALLLADILDMQPDFRIEVFDPALKLRQEQEKVLEFADQVIAAWLAGKIVEFAQTTAVMPATVQLANEAKTKWLSEAGIRSLDPWLMTAPGDALREISRGVEWELFREYQRRERAVALVRLVLGDHGGSFTTSAVIRALVDRLPDIDALMLSAAQQRKSRAGYSFEHHIESMLLDGNVPFQKQVVIEAKKRPDFILPSLSHLTQPAVGKAAGLILSAKTTLRERWKQVEREMKGRELFLATVDESIASNAIEEMHTMGITLVVPEALKAASNKMTEYAGHKNVISFKSFFQESIRSRIETW
ncbi:MAG: restriction endonuclease [Hyphomicrobium sp.]|nr:restriction endonuclease [Hyphomicrobium sp.]